jgi:uncharacterized protein (DUF1800 family)
MRQSAILLVLASSLLVPPAFAQPAVTVSPTAVSVHVGTFVQFSAKVTGATPTTVGWTVALPAGATGSPGTISAGGRYTPPAVIPDGGTVIVTVTTIATPAASASATVTLQNPFPTLASVMPSTIAAGAFTLTLNGSGFVPGAHARLGGMVLATTFVSATRLTATGTAAGMTGAVPLQVENPDPGSALSVDTVSVQVGSVGSPQFPANVVSRFLDHAAFGPDAATIAHIQSLASNPRDAFVAYLNEQFAAPVSPYPDPSMTSFGINQVQARFFSNAVHGQDQLRQRVAFIWSQIMVASAVEENTPTQLVPYLQILQRDAFVNFRTLMEDVTLSPTMGEYLDMRNNDKANPATDTRANENYARELMQLFSIGLSQLNQDGTLQLDSKGQPIPTYDQTAIQNFAKVYTGWTYPTKPGATPQRHNPAYFVGPMVPFAANHDETSKTLLNGVVIPAGQTPNQDLKEALDNIFNHPNVGPFISKQLIQHLITSNPSPDYVSRIAAVFNDDGSAGHVRGNMQSVITAILLDPDAQDTSASFFGQVGTVGHLREPVFLVSSILRGLSAAVNDTNNLTGQAANLGQNIFAPASVFSYFAPSYTIPPEFTAGAAVLGPEFQILSPSAAIARANLVNSIIYGNLGAGAVIDLAPFSASAGAPQNLVNAISQTFFYGDMPAAMQTQLLSAVNALPGTSAAVLKARAQAALYVALSSSYYTVEH